MRFLGNDAFVCNRRLVILLSAGVLAASWVYAPYVDRGPVVCMLHGIVGLPCPACGLTHAFCDLAHGRLASAAVHNAFVFPLFLIFLVAVPTAAVELMIGRRLNYYRFMYSTRVAYAAGTALVLYHLARTGVWLLSGRLYSDYITTSWTYHLWRHVSGWVESGQ